MTPGFAKPRSKLPWLPYGVCDRVTINAHNFTQIWTPSVNGKPAAHAWVPSRDTAGNGTTTLTDLAGSSNGTLTNFALTGGSSNWLADTGIGGVRAIDSDGTNDKITTALTIGTVSSCSLSMWIKFNSVAAWGVPGGWWSGSEGIFLQTYTSSSLLFLAGNGSSGYSISATGVISTGTWYHVALVYDGSLTGNANRLKGYINGSLLTFAQVRNIAATVACGSATFTLCDTGSLGRYFNGRLDDVRHYSVALNATDIANLYTAQRGGQA